MLHNLTPSNASSVSVSYVEFLSMFRQNRTNLFDIIEPAESVYSEDDLVGLDAKIPGGKFDSSRSGA